MDATEGNLVECCKLGLMHTANGRFLTIEVFNNEVNVSGTALRKRQVWSMLVDANSNTTDAGQSEGPLLVYWLSPFGRLLSADKDGRVNCNSTQIGPDEQFCIEFNPSGNGEMAIKSAIHGYYLNGNETQVSCFSKTIRWWALRLAMHPQINIKNLFRNRYAHVLANQTELRCDLAQPWDRESVFRLVQLPLPQGGTLSQINRYGQVAICTEPTGQQKTLYLRPDGSLSTEMNSCNMFSLEIKPGQPTMFSFKHVESSAYLSAIGQGTLKTKSNQNASTKTREEMFFIERAACQVAVLASNDKFVSMKQGVEILANQRELNDTEIFQLEYLGQCPQSFEAARVIQAALSSMKELGAGPNDDIRVLNNNNNNNQSAFESMCASALLSGRRSTLVQNKVSNENKVTQEQSNGTRQNGNHAPTGPLYLMTTGYWRLRSKENKLWNLRPNAPVHHTGTEGDPNSEFSCYYVINTDPKPGSMILLSRGSNLSVTSKKLGAVSCGGPGPQLNDTAPEKTVPADELFRVHPFVNRAVLIIQSVITGGFLSRNQVSSKTKLAGIPLDCMGPSYDEFIIRHVANKGSCQLYTMPKVGTTFGYWCANENGLYVQSSSVPLEQDLNELETDPEPGTEFVFYFLGQGRCLIRLINSPDFSQNAFCLLRAEPKGDVKVVPTTSVEAITANMIWEI